MTIEPEATYESDAPEYEDYDTPDYDTPDCTEPDALENHITSGDGNISLNPKGELEFSDEYFDNMNDDSNYNYNNANNSKGVRPDSLPCI